MASTRGRPRKAHPARLAFLDPEEGWEGLAGEKLLFAVALDEGGCNAACYRMLSVLRRGEGLLDGCTAGLVVTGPPHAPPRPSFIAQSLV